MKISFWHRPARSWEAPVLALIGGLVVLSAGRLMGRDSLAVVGIAALVVMGILALPILLSPRILPILLTVGLVGVIVSFAYVRDVTQIELRRQEAPAASPVPPPVRTIQIAPCPEKWETLARRPDGSYVCLYTLPANPGGPKVAAPTAQR